MAVNKTVANASSVAEMLSSVAHPRRREESVQLHTLFSDVTGWDATMWGSSIVGYGRYHYVYDSGREGDYFATGFSPRQRGLSIYIMPGYADFTELLSKLGKYRRGKSCLNINSLDDINLDVLASLIRAGLSDLERLWPVSPS